MKKKLNWLMIHYKQYSPVTGGKNELKTSHAASL